MANQDTAIEQEVVDPFADPKVRQFPQEFVRKMQDVTPTIGPGYLGRPTVAVYKHEDAVAVLRNSEVFSNENTEDVGQIRPLIPHNYDPPQHSKYRKLTDPLFSPKRVAALESQTRQLVRELIEQVKTEGRINFHYRVAEPIPSTVFLQLLGLPVSRTKEFIALKDGILHREEGTVEEQVASMRATGVKIYKLFRDLINERQAAPKDDLISGFLQSEVDGERLTPEDVEDIGYLFFLAGLDTVTGALDCMMTFLAQHPEHRQQIVDDPSLIPSAVEELLRWDSSVSGLLRIATQDTEVAGCPVPAGTMVAVSVLGANVDERAWDNPLTVDFHRPENKHIAFGAGVHRCLGSHLARMELRVVLSEWHRLIPDYRVPDDVELDFVAGMRQVPNLELEW